MKPPKFKVGDKAIWKDKDVEIRAIDQRGKVALVRSIWSGRYFAASVYDMEETL